MLNKVAEFIPGFLHMHSRRTTIFDTLVKELQIQTEKKITSGLEN
jgi:hypothetical protein